MAPRSAEVFMRSGALLRKLKGFIENEIDILHQYNKDEAEMCKGDVENIFVSSCTLPIRSWKTIAGGVVEVCLSPRDLDRHIT